MTPNNPLQFKLCGLFQLSVRHALGNSFCARKAEETDNCSSLLFAKTQIDLLLCGQTFLYRKETARDLAERAELRDQAGVAGTESLLPPRPAPSPKAVEAATESLLPGPLPPAARHYDEESEVDSR